MDINTKLFAVLVLTVFITTLISVVSAGEKGGSGGSGGLIIISNNKPRLGQMSDLIIFGGGDGCPPGLIKDGGRKGKSMFVLPGECKKPKKKVVYKVLPVPVMHEHGGYGGGGGY